MQRRAHFGRRTTAEPAYRSAPAPVAFAEPAPAELDFDVRSDMAAVASADAELKREIESWNKERKLRRRALREPWRSVSIVAGIGFGLSSWLLPDAVANIADLVTGGLTVAAFAAALRRPPDDGSRHPDGPQLP